MERRVLRCKKSRGWLPNQYLTEIVGFCDKGFFKIKKEFSFPCTYTPAGILLIDAIENLEIDEEDRRKPSVVSSQVIRRVDDYQTQLINRMRHGNMILPGQTLYIMECEPAAYSALAANEAEKAAQINILEVRAFGSFGRVYIGGEERDVVVAHEAATQAIEAVTGTKKK